VVLPDSSKVFVPAIVMASGAESYSVAIPNEAHSVVLSLKLSDSMATAVGPPTCIMRILAASSTIYSTLVYWVTSA
jgi:hypothetical protein